MKPHEMTMTFANSMTVDEIIRKIEAAIDRYKKDPTPGNRITLANCCHVMLYKQVCEVHGFEQALNKIDKVVTATRIVGMQNAENG